MMETNLNDLLHKGEIIRQWIKLAEYDLAFVEKIYNLEPSTSSVNLLAAESTV